MADRTSAEIFGELFDLLAEDLTKANKKLASKMYQKTMCYDFSQCQMEADEALIKLGLAKMGIDSEYPEEGEIVLYNDFK